MEVLCITCSTGEVWKQYRSDTAKQVIPRRVRNFVEPLCVVTEDLLSYLETLQDEVGNVQDIVPELNKWGFQSTLYSMRGWGKGAGIPSHIKSKIAW